MKFEEILIHVPGGESESDEHESDEQGRTLGPVLFYTKDGYVLNTEGERVDSIGRLWHPRGCPRSMRSRRRNRPNQKKKKLEQLIREREAYLNFWKARGGGAAPSSGDGGGGYPSNQPQVAAANESKAIVCKSPPTVQKSPPTVQKAPPPAYKPPPLVYNLYKPPPPVCKSPPTKSPPTKSPPTESAHQVQVFACQQV